MRRPAKKRYKPTVEYEIRTAYGGIVQEGLTKSAALESMRCGATGKGGYIVKVTRQRIS